MDYYAITRDMTQLGLKGSRLTVYALVYKFSSDGQSAFFGSLSYVSEWCGISRPQAAQILRDLTADGFITRDDSNGRPHYRVVGVRKTECSENRTPCSESRTGCSENRTPSYNREDNKDIIKNTCPSPRTREDMNPYGEFVRMTAANYARLVSRFGADDAARLCEILDSYLAKKPNVYRDHYRAALGWPVQRLQEEKLNQQRLKNAQEAAHRVAPQQQGPPPGNYAALAEARARREAIEAKYKH